MNRRLIPLVINFIKKHEVGDPDGSSYYLIQPEDLVDFIAELMKEELEVSDDKTN